MPFYLINNGDVIAVDEVFAICEAIEEYKNICKLVRSTEKSKLIRENSIDNALKNLENDKKTGIFIVTSQQLSQYINSCREKIKNKLYRLEEYEEKYHSLIELSNEYPDIIGRSIATRNVCKQIGIVSKSDSNVLIQGESGTGKEVVARTIHNNSLHARAPFVSINCAAIPEGLLESELFGYVKGAFTGAVRDYQGRLKQAQNGTFLFDEICSMSLSGQAKLLRVLQEREFQPVGGTNTIRFEARIIATSNVNLLSKVKEKKFREDLYYRLNVFPILLPPLRERKEDIPPLARHFLRKYKTILKKEINDIDPSVLAILLEHDWPGNIRELENYMEYAVIVEKTECLRPNSLPFRSVDHPPIANVTFLNNKSLKEKLAIVEREIILDALEKTNWVKKDATKLLGIDPKNMNYYLAKNNISEPEKYHRKYDNRKEIGK